MRKDDDDLFYLAMLLIAVITIITKEIFDYMGV